MVAAVIAARWPEACDPDLRAHASECPACRVTVELATVLRRDGVRATRDLRVPAPGLVWQRAVVRARAEAAQQASRPVAWAQGATAACLGGAAVAAAVLTWPVVRGSAGRFAQTAGGLGTPDWLELASPLVEAVGRSLPLVLVIAGCVLAMPLLALYVAWSSERGE